MGINRILKPGLFIYECVRIIVLAFTLAYIMQPGRGIPWLAFAAPGVLFPLMALFIWIDVRRYNNFVPLYIAGKCIGIFAFISWSMFSGSNTIFRGTEYILMSGDFLALAAILLIRREIQCE